MYRAPVYFSEVRVHVPVCRYRICVWYCLLLQMSYLILRGAMINFFCVVFKSLKYKYVCMGIGGVFNHLGIYKYLSMGMYMWGIESLNYKYVSVDVCEGIY